MCIVHHVAELDEIDEEDVVGVKRTSGQSPKGVAAVFKAPGDPPARRQRWAAQGRWEDAGVGAA